MGFFERYLTVWVILCMAAGVAVSACKNHHHQTQVILCMAAGVAVGKFLPFIPGFLGQFEYANVSVPIAVLIWIMIYPMMLKVDFASIKNVGRNPKGLFVTWVTNWLIKPFTMFGIASLFFYGVFANLITPELAKDYLAGAILLGAAPCTAMVFGAI